MKSTAQFRRRLLDWYRASHRDLPWRATRDPYRIWLSEIMLQQTRVETVLPYYEVFLKRFRDATALAAAPETEVLALWSGLGYYSRARNLHRAAKQIVQASSFPTIMRSFGRCRESGSTRRRPWPAWLSTCRSPR